MRFQKLSKFFTEQAYTVKYIETLNDDGSQAHEDGTYDVYAVYNDNIAYLFHVKTTGRPKYELYINGVLDKRYDRQRDVIEYFERSTR